MCDRDNMNASERDDMVLGTLTATNAAWSKESQQQMSQMVDEIIARNEKIQSIVRTGQGYEIRGGIAVESVHAETFNLEALLQNKTARACIDKDFHSPLKVNDPVADIAITDNGTIVKSAQSKYFKTSQLTANDMRKVCPDGSHHYAGADTFLGPSDQVTPLDGKSSITDALHRTKLKNAETRPDVAKAADYTESRVSDRLDYDGIQSRPVSKHEANMIGKDGKHGQAIRKEYQNNYMTKSTVQQMQNAAASAAGIAAIMAGTLHTVQYLKLVKEGKISQGDAVYGILKNTAAASADSSLKAAAATGAVSVVTRLAAGTVAQQAVTGLLARSGIAGAAICSVDLIQCMVMVAAGKMTPGELETRVGKNAIQVAGGVAGSSIGIGIATALGVTVGVAPVLAALAGGLIVGTALTIAIDNGIEKPFREVIANTTALTVAEDAMRNCSEAMCYGQKAFMGFVVADATLNDSIREQFLEIDRAGEKMKEHINQI